MLKINNVSFSYSNKPVIDQLSAHFQPHKIHGILGANGAGKTTLFQLIYGILSPGDGNILLEDQPISGAQIGYLETENYFYPYMKGQEYLALLSHANPDFNIALWNDIFNLPLDELVDTYSTGMKKKLALLGILSLDRPVMLLDEPFNGLDLKTVENLHRLLKELKKRNKIIIITSHILPVLKQNCDHISFLHEGKIPETFGATNFDQIDEVINAKLMQDSESILRKIFAG